MPPESRSAPEVLHERAAAIRAVQGREANEFTRATERLALIARDLGAPIAIVGGLAGIHHGALVTTLDVDVVVSAERLNDFLEVAQRYGLEVKSRSPTGWHLLVYRDADGSDVTIGIVPEGGRSPRDPERAPPIPGPRELGVEAGLGYASFDGWVAMKLVANRDKDRYHLIEALKTASQEQVSRVVVRVRKLHPSYLAELERLVRAAEDEQRERW